MRHLFPVFLLFLASCSSQRYYIVRHAEKEVLTKDSAMFSAANPPLSNAGQVRAFVLRDELKKKHIGTIYSTNYHRTMNTARPLSQAIGVPIYPYSASKDSLEPFITRLNAIHRKSVLIVGHSNTIDDLVNRLTGERSIPGDLNESIYDNMYILTRKKDKYLFAQKKYGYPSNPENSQ
jgi:broad specificity phosphatase PhoE